MNFFGMFLPTMHLPFSRASHRGEGLLSMRARVRWRKGL